MEEYKKKFEQIVKGRCYNTLAEYMKIIPIMYLPDILSNYYISVFRPAGKEFGNLMTTYSFDETCEIIAFQIIERHIIDSVYGKYFTSKNS
jgi:hypothetical protein